MPRWSQALARSRGPVVLSALSAFALCAALLAVWPAPDALAQIPQVPQEPSLAQNEAPLETWNATLTGAVVRNLRKSNNRRYFLRAQDGKTYYLGNDATLTLTFRQFLDEATTNGLPIVLTGTFERYASGILALRATDGYSYKLLEDDRQ